MPLLAASYALGFALEDLTRDYGVSAADDRREIEGRAAGLKAHASWLASRTVQTCRECCGAQGYLAVNRFAALKADAEIFTTFEGDNTVLLQLVAKGLLTRFKKQFSDMDFFGMLRYLADQVAVTLAEQNPVIIRRTDESHLRDPEFQLDVFRARENDLLTSVAQRLKRRLDDGIDSFEAFNQCQNHLIALAHASVEREVLERFTHAIGAVADPDLAGVLAQLRDLHAMARLEADIGWFLENDYMEGKKARAIRDQVELLSAEVRVEALALVEAFAIPENCLGAPIATGNEIGSA